MTVICYDNKVKRMAADSLCSDGGYFVTTCNKLFRTSAGALIGTSGNSECRNALALFDKVATPEELPSMQEIQRTKNEISWLVVLPDNSVWTVWNFYDDYRHDEDCWIAGLEELEGRFSATGHGMDFAKAALEAGSTVEQAVKIACKHSLFCRPPVQTIDLVENEKPKSKRKTKTVKAVNPLTEKEPHGEEAQHRSA